MQNSLPSLATLPSHPELLGCRAGKAFCAWKGEIPAPPLLRSLSFGQGVCVCTGGCSDGRWSGPRPYLALVP